MLPGLGHDHQLFNGTPTVRTLTHITTYSVSHPTNGAFFIAGGGGAIGDIVIATGRYQGGSFSAAPSGFTTLYAQPVDGTIWAGYRIMQSGDVGAIFQNTGDGAQFVTQQMVFRPDIRITNLVISAVQTQGPTDGDPGDIIVAQPTAPAFVYMYAQSSGSISAGTAPTATHSNSGSFANILMTANLFNASPSAVTCSINDTGNSNFILAGSIAVT